MYRLNLIKKYLIDSQLFVSLTGTSFALFFMFEQDIIKLPTIFLLFLTFFSGYLYTKYLRRPRVFPRILIFNVISGIICVALIIHNHNEIRLLKWLFIVILGLFYDTTFQSFFVRRIPLFKIFYVGLTWALINSWLILPGFSTPVFLISLLFISALVLPFDIRDMESDEIVTFPRLIGVQNTKYLAYVLVFLSLMIAIFTLKYVFAAAFFLTCLVTFFLIFFAETKNHDLYFSFWAESCAALPLLFFLLLRCVGG